MRLIFVKYRETQENLSFEPDLKSELDKLLETARCTLQRLEEEFSHNVDISPWIIHCYREILRINRNCKDLDRMLSSHYFCDTKLTHTVSVIRKELKREKAAKVSCFLWTLDDESLGLEVLCSILQIVIVKCINLFCVTKSHRKGNI